MLEVLRQPLEDQGRACADQALATFARDYPAAMRSLAEDLEASLAHLKLPPVHRRSNRTTNLIERNFVEERRRAKSLSRA